MTGVQLVTIKLAIVYLPIIYCATHVLRVKKTNTQHKLVCLTKIQNVVRVQLVLLGNIDGSHVDLKMLNVQHANALEQTFTGLAAVVPMG